MSRLFSRVALVSVAVIGAAAFSSAALANDWSSERNREGDEMHLNIKNVDFNNPSQVNALYRRLKVAANSVCSSDGPVDLMTRIADQACEREALSDAVRQINNPQLSLLDAQNNSGQSGMLALTAPEADSNR